MRENEEVESKEEKEDEEKYAEKGVRGRGGRTPPSPSSSPSPPICLSHGSGSSPTVLGSQSCRVNEPDCCAPRRVGGFVCAGSGGSREEEEEEWLREKGVLPTEGKRRTEKGTEGRERAVRKGNRDGSVRLDTRGGVLGCESGR